ncbi:MAG: hypothetical protein V5A34_13225 [Halapricum sp.]
MDRWSGVFAVVLVLSCSLGVVAAAPGPESPSSAEGPALTSAQTDFSRTTYELSVYENGSVRWTARYTKPLNDSEVSAYETYAAEFNSTETELYAQFQTTADRLTDIGTNATGRQMNASAFSRRAYVAETGDSGFTLGTQGVVEMSFMWSNFAEQSGDRLRIGDVFTNGLYLGPDRRLVIATTGDLQFIEADPTPDSNSSETLRDSETITWNGEREFNDQQPMVRLAPQSSNAFTTTAGTETRTSPPTETTTGSPAATGGGSDLPPVLPILLVVLVIAAGSGVVWYLVRDGGDVLGSGGVATELSSGPDEPDASSAGTETATESETGQGAAVTDEELLSDADRIRSLLESNGGRMHQSTIVEETEWSKSKVSMLLSDMEDDDEITKLRVGRENIVSLPGHEPDAAGSPFKDE